MTACRCTAKTARLPQITPLMSWSISSTQQPPPTNKCLFRVPVTSLSINIFKVVFFSLPWVFSFLLWTPVLQSTHSCLCLVWSKFLRFILFVHKWYTWDGRELTNLAASRLSLENNRENHLSVNFISSGPSQGCLSSWMILTSLSQSRGGEPFYSQEPLDIYNIIHEPYNIINLEVSLLY